MPSTRTGTDRFNEACTYLNGMSNGGRALRDAVLATSAGKENLWGNKLSLEGQGIRLVGTDAQHQAVKALVLCELAFNSRPYIPAVDIKGMPIAEITEAEILATKKTFLPKLHGTVDGEIREYMLGADRSLDNLCRASKRVRNAGTTSIPMWRKKRSENYFSDGAFVICYDGVKMWLYASGMVSRRWLSSTGLALSANTSKTVFGAGATVLPAQWDQIEAGYFWSVEKKRTNGTIDTTTCHWGLSLGGGLAVGTNNTYATAAADRSLINLNFQDKEGQGNLWGIYRFREICNILNRDFKYRSSPGTDDPTAPDQNIIVSKYNPMNMVGAF